MQLDQLAHHLRELRLDDAKWIYSACQDSEIQRWTKVPRPYTYEHAESFVKDFGGEFAAFAIVHSSTDEPVGVAGIHHVSAGIASIGYWVARWGRKLGAATDALHVLQSVISCNTDAHTICALIAETNSASRRTAERAGFTLRRIDATTCPDGTDQVQALRYEKEVR